jgi:hypothetical protein
LSSGYLYATADYTLISGISVDGFNFTVNVNANGNAPALTATPTFIVDASLAGAGVQSTGQASSLVVLVASISPALTGSHVIGSVNVSIPAGAQSGQTYSIQITSPGGTLNGNNGNPVNVPLVAGSNATLSVGVPYLVGDVSPWLDHTQNRAGQFGDTQVTTTDLIWRYGLWVASAGGCRLNVQTALMLWTLRQSRRGRRWVVTACSVQQI